MRRPGVTARDISRRDALRALGALAALVSVGDLAACASSKSPSRPTTSRSLPGTPPSTDVVSTMRAFADNWYRVAGDASDNWTISPLSAVLALGMLRAGARGTSATALDAAVGFAPSSDPAGSMHADLHRVTTRVLQTPDLPKGAPPAPVLSIANGVFLDRRFAPSVRHAFLDLLHAQYGTQVQVDDLNAPGAVDIINGWAAQQTHGLIRKVLAALPPPTALVLADAVYLKAAWAAQFERARTAPGPFRTAGGATVSVPMMQQSFHEPIGYLAGAGWQRVDLAYVSSDLTMRVVVPTQRLTSATDLRPMVTAAMAPDKSGPELVTLTLPRWRTTTSTDLGSVLSDLGAGVLFTDRADLSGVAAGLMVGQARQSALINVDEHGTEAAAVTVVTLVPTSLTNGAPKVVVADRPFAWAIVHEPTGTPLFAGHVVNPAS